MRSRCAPRAALLAVLLAGLLLAGPLAGAPAARAAAGARLAGSAIRAAAPDTAGGGGAGTTVPGIELGPPAPTSVSPAPTSTVGGDQATHAAFWDLPGRVRQAIDDWFRGLVLDALTPTLDLVGKTVLSTPQLASNAQIAGLWQISLVSADALLVVCLLLGAGLAMSHETLQTSYALKDLLRRLAVAGIAVNASLSIVDQLGGAANALAAAFLGDGASAASAGASLQTFVVGALAGGGIFLTLLGLAVAVAAVALLLLYLLRAAIVVALACAAPLVLLGHLFPQSEGLAQLWWRALGAVFAVQVLEALLLATCVRVFFAGGAPGLGLSVGGSVVDLLLCLCLLVVLVRVPFWAKELVFGRRGSGSARLLRLYALARIGRAAF